MSSEANLPSISNELKRRNTCGGRASLQPPLVSSIGCKLIYEAQATNNSAACMHKSWRAPGTGPTADGGSCGL